MGTFCMVDRSPVLSQLNQVIDALNNITDTVKNKKQSPKNEEMTALIKILQSYNNKNTNTDPHFWEDKKFEQDEGIDETIKQALEAVEIFQRMIPDPTKPFSRRNVNEAVAALYAAFDKEKELSKFEANIKNLKERWKKLKAKVQGSEQGQLN